jgi:hypothetical protein
MEEPEVVMEAGTADGTTDEHAVLFAPSHELTDPPESPPGEPAFAWDADAAEVFAQVPGLELELQRRLGVGDPAALARELDALDEFTHTHMTAEERQFLTKTGLGNDPVAIGFLSRIRGIVAENEALKQTVQDLRTDLKVRPATPGGLSPQDALTQLEQARIALREGRIMRHEFARLEARLAPLAYAVGFAGEDLRLDLPA